MTGAGAPAVARGTASSATPPFAALPTAAGLAREHVRAALADWGLSGFADVTELIASELVSNAVTAYARMPASARLPLIRVCLITDGDVLTVEVWD